MKRSIDNISCAPIKRWQWCSHKKFMMLAIGATEGLGNICRFPTYMSLNGNGVFLIPYLLMKIFFVIPITYMQMALGQYSGKGPLNVWILCPLSQGIGYAILILGWFVLIFNNTVITFSLYYFFSSFQSQLPWTHCDHAWASENCMVRSKNASTTANCMMKYNLTVCRKFRWETSAQHFWLVRVLGYSPGEDVIANGFGPFKLDLVLCLFLSCFLVFVATARGLKTMEKIVYFTTIYPFAGLTVLLIGTSLDAGAARGLSYFVMGELSLLADFEVWVKAYDLAMQSTGLGYGVLITLGSYCTFRSPTNMDAIILNIIDIFVGIMSSVISFNCIGIIGFHFGMAPITIVNSGYNIPFALVPEALAYIPGSGNFWSLLYFSTIFCFGITTEYFIMASNLSVIYDRFPRLTKYPVIVSACGCVFLFILGLPLCTTNGTALANDMDIIISGTYHGTVLAIQLFVVLWVYALGRFSDDVHFMLGFRPSNFFQVCWFLAPPFSLGALIYDFISTHKKLATVNPDLVLTMWMILYNIPLSIVILIGIINIVIYCRNKKLRLIMKPVADWGPTDPVLIKSRRMFNAQAMTKEYMYRQSRLGAHGRNLMQNATNNSNNEHK